MSREEFDRMPRRLGWKHEYYGEQAHITPSYRVVSVRLTIQEARTLALPDGCRRRSPREEDRAGLEDLFVQSFYGVADFCDYDETMVRQAAETSLSDFYRKPRNAAWRAARCCECSGDLVGAALTSGREAAAYLELLMVAPQCRRQGLAGALLRAALNRLRREGYETLQSRYFLANEVSGAWHRKQGFEEWPDLFLTEHRLHHAECELDRLLQAGASAVELNLWQNHSSRLRRQAKAMREVADRDGLAAVLPPRANHAALPLGCRRDRE